MKKHLLPIFLIIFLSITGCQPDEEDPGYIVNVHIGEVTSSMDDAEITGSYSIKQGNPEINEAGFCWIESSGSNLPTITDNFARAYMEGKNFKTTITNLSPDTYYRVRPYVKIGELYLYGDTHDFQTLSTVGFLPKLQDIIYSAIDTNSVTLNAGIENIFEKYPISDAGFCYTQEEKFPTIEDIVTKGEINTSNKLYASLSELDFATTYFVRAYAINAAGITYSNREVFTTKAAKGAPKFSDIIVDYHGVYTLELSCKISSQTDVTNLQLAYKEKYSSAWIFIDTELNEDNTLSIKIENLQSTSAYEVKILATNSFGNSVSDILEIITKSEEYLIPEFGYIKIEAIGGTYLDISCPVSSETEFTDLKFGYRLNDESDWKYVEATIEDKNMKTRIPDLEFNTSYFLIATASNNYGTNHSYTSSTRTKRASDLVPSIYISDIKQLLPEVFSFIAPYSIPDENYPVITAGFEYEGNGSNLVQEIKSELNDGQIYLKLEDLALNNRSYKIRAYAENLAGKTYSSYYTFQTTHYGPQLLAPELIDKEPYWLKVSAELTPFDDKHPVIKGGFYYRSTSSRYPNVYEKQEGIIENNTINATISNLISGTSYYVKAYAQIDDEFIHYGPEITLQTTHYDEVVPISSEPVLSELLINGVTLNATIKQTHPSFPILEAGFKYDGPNNPNAIYNGTIVEGEWDNEKVTLKLENLNPNRDYQVVTYTKSEAGYRYSSPVNFKTLGTNSYPSVICNDYTYLNDNKIKISGIATENHSSYPIQETGFVYVIGSYVDKPTLDMSFAVRKKCSWNEYGEFETIIDDLEQNKTYQIRAYTISRNNIVSYSTEIYQITGATESVPVINNVTVKKNGAGADVHSSVKSGSGFEVTEYGFIYGIASSITMDNNLGAIDLSNKSFETFISLPAPITGSTTYYIKAYAKNSQGIGYSNPVSLNISWND